ncbi:M28 family peptidase [Janthinobacterium psychrotolerans]|uniref:Zn-dependent amino-or carboxypeptidase, M28 family n=1 Tax=Janthinobacterium psychrotolerans TaxID=1747903 RepID=A0A1A7C0C1_9BURK|nr:M28 family peptidase [Janthinobacterium psychrotolerans]OBV39376.1 Zn-dependent amino- or carboxypeptidase, M28 family [Janthinobacterium psychrotolerans]
MQTLFLSLAATSFAASLALAFPVHAANNLPTVQEAPLRAHLAFLSDDLLEGRGTGQRGADLTVAYLESQARLIGLQPLRGNSFRQSVRIAGVKSRPQDSSLKATGGGGQAVPLAFGPDWVWATGDSAAAHTFDAPLVFAGYGVTAPEEGWNDFKGIDVKGKIIVVMVNDPQPTEAAPNRFGGKALTYYGRWTYKFEEARRQGAAGVLLIHTKPSASYDWSVVQSSWSGSERFQLAGATSGTPLQGWIAEDAARRLFAAGGQDLDALRAKAESKDFQAVALNARLTGQMKSSVRKVEQFNIAGMVPGTDAELKNEAVIYSGHWDHLGKQGDSGDTIYNGAVDNASGTAGLLAMAQEAVKKPARRTQIFLWVAAEEQGLLGSAAYAADPLWPLNKTAAALNLDSLNFVGATRDMGAQGSERTELGAMAASVAKAMGLQIAAARPDLAGGYFRSDHFSFAKAGVPAFSINGGRDYVKDPEASKARAAAYGPRYHQVTDEYDASWDLSGMTQQAQFTLNLGQAVANAPKMPAWKAGDAFGKVREQAAK